MARRTYEFTVNNVDYTATTFPGRKGMKCITLLIKMIGPSLGQAFAGYDTADSALDISSLSEGIKSLVSNLNSDEVISLVDSLLETVQTIIDGKKVKADLDDYFAGNYGELVQVLFNVIKENYSSFFGDGVSKLMGLVPQELTQGSVGK